MVKLHTKEEIIKEVEEKTKLGDIKKFEEIGLSLANIISIYPTVKGSEFTFKLDFLSEFAIKNYSTSTFKQYITLFKRIKPIEELYEKDICDFSGDEMIALLDYFKSKSYNSIGSKYSLFKNYINEAKSKNIGKVVNPTGLSLKASDLKSVIAEDKRDSSYCTRTQLEEALEQIKNPNDKVVYALLFEGIMGESYEDLLNLKEENIDLSQNILTTPSGKTYKFSDNTKQILKDCMTQLTAVMFDGHRTYKIDTSSPYILKAKLTGTSNGEAMKFNGLSRKLVAVRKYMDLDFITGKAVYSSGLLERVCLYEHNTLKRKLATLELASYVEGSIDSIDRNTLIRLVQDYRKKFYEDLEKRNWMIVGKN